MKYFYDTEFLEGAQKKGWFGRETVPTIDLISIGIVAEDGREYYAVSKEFNLKEAWNRWQPEGDDVYVSKSRRFYWIRENVLKPIYKHLLQKERYAREHHYELVEPFSYKTLKNLIQWHGKTRKQIADEVIDFCKPTIRVPVDKASEYEAVTGIHSTTNTYGHNGMVSVFNIGDPIFYGYYSAYDHVALCWLFGKMMNLPKGFPMYTRDLKQMFDEVPDYNPAGTFMWEGELHASVDPAILRWSDFPSYPKQENEHHALADARWNKKLYDFIQSIKEQ
jgi:hypothetical protein